MNEIKSEEIKIVVKDAFPASKKLLNNILSSTAVKKYFSGSKYRILDTQIFEPDVKEKATMKCQSQFSDFYNVVAYDYIRNRCVFLKIGSARSSAVEISESVFQPEPNDDEFREAVKILIKKYDRLIKGVKEKLIRFYKPMPPTINLPLPDGEIQRTLTVGIHSLISGIHSEIVGVNMITGAITHFDTKAPQRTLSGGSHCGINDANQSTTTKGTAGKCWVTVTQAGKTIWKFQVIRPAASSGTVGSGVELKYVDYKGKRVLYQGHVPILNVRYDGDACGPYRDWQWMEGMFTANGNDIVPGIRLCTSPARTILDTENDSGNFKGVAIYVIGQEVVLVSEMEAGWYRYISEWRLHTNGTIKPRFGFVAVHNSCVCNIHHHHVYWRLDFDIGTAGNNLVEEYNNPILVGNSNWHKKRYEIRRLKNAARHRKWKISNIQTGHAYELLPGDHDGIADNFGVGDLWILRYHGGSEIDDGVNIVSGTPEECKAHIDKFINGESVENKDVVIWYGAHFTHDINEESGHIVGPTIKPLVW